ncbi:NAD(P)-dependent oxidoreductase [Hoeflea sp. G2-23]|uniref:NAD(P)-dependent oxidoreductase n=1 Tax=Hoeflea algicola TaxID=2983763 RepID=A0ABT3ZBU9_9HYPH|nr:NAD(P)-dependent oxidoreductase [Hoeflea algicola]MCY0149280.1 NAD(P)-dependent oxidoreductase [Hoeflea algicola]
MSTRVHLVTGAGGLVGRAVTDQLRARGDRVIGIDRMASGEGDGRIIDCDLRDTHRLHQLAYAHDLDTIIHCGAHSGPMVARDNPYDLVSVNVIGTANVLEIARVRRLRRFVNCSSVSVYGATVAGPVVENVPLHPSTVYGATKLAAEYLVTAYAKEHRLAAVSLRLSWVYGPNRTTNCLLRRMVDDAIEGKPTRVDWGAGFHRQYIHADDAAAALIAAVDAASIDQHAYNITGDTYQTLTETAELVRRVLPQADIRFGEGNDPGDDVQHRFDITAARRDLDYVPAISLEEGIRRFAETIKEQR